MVSHIAGLFTENIHILKNTCTSRPILRIILFSGVFMGKDPTTPGILFCFFRTYLNSGMGLFTKTSFRTAYPSFLSQVYCVFPLALSKASFLLKDRIFKVSI